MASKTKSAILEQFELATTLAIAPLLKAAGPITMTTTSKISAVVNGGAGNEVLNGTATADTISGLGGNDTLNGLAGDDVLLGGIGNDRLDGSTGNDTLDGGTGNDTMIGGAGNDVYVVDAIGDMVSEAGGSGTDRVEAGISFTLATGFENLTLTGTAALTGTGNAANNVILGNAGANVLQGGGGVDTINGGSGNDQIVVTATELNVGSVFDGDTGVDMLLGDTVTTLANLTTVTLTELESIEGFEGGVRLTAAQLDGFTGDVNIWGDITLTTGGTVDLRDAHVYSEVIRLANLDTTLILNSGRSIAGGMFSGTVFGGTANDTVTLTGFNGIGGSTLFGGAGNDALTGSAKADQLVGGSGRDSLFGGAGNDVLRLTRLTDLQAGETYAGGAGDDVLDGRAVLQLTDFATAGTTFLTLESIEGFRRGVTMTAAQLDQFSGEIDVWGDISIATGGVVDLSDASIFTDNIFLNNAGNQITVAGGYGIDGNGGDFTGTIYGGTGNDTITVISGYQAGLAPGIDLVGGAGDDTITGGATREELYGGIGRDSLAGGGGDDVLVIFDGDVETGEVYDGGTGQDTLTGETELTVNLSGVTISGIEHITGFFGGLALSATQLNAFAGAIEMSGELFILNSGAVNLGGATLILQQINLNAGGNQITVAGNTGGFGQALGEIAGGAGNDTITVVGGTAGVRGASLLGGNGNDTITGGATDDDITGGAGVDSLSGGAGDDIFTFATLSEIQPGEVYNGGTGQDTLDGNEIFTPFNLDSAGLTLTSVEAITGFAGGVQMTAAQLAAFTARVDVIGTVTVTTGGTINLGGAVVTTNEIDLAAAGNAITLTAGTETTANFNGRVTGGNGNDAITILGGDQFGSTRLFGGGGNDTILAGGGDDIIRGGVGVDSLDAGAGDDTLAAVAGDLASGETYIGGAGIDTLELSAITTTVDLSQISVNSIEAITAGGSLQLTAGQANGFTESVFVNGDLILTSGGLVDFSQSNVAVDQLILSAAGNTVIVAQPINGSANFNGDIIGGVGNDNITVLGGAYSGVNVDAGDGDDTIVGGGGNEQLTGGAGNDVITGGSGGYSTMNGNAGNDTITGSIGNDQITGGTGTDSLVGGGGDDRFILEIAADIVAGEVYDGGAGIDLLDGLGIAPPVDITGVTITSIESIRGFNNGLTLTAAQFAGFTEDVSVGELTLTTGGTINMTGTRFSTGSTINLSNTATNLTLTADGSGYTDTSFFGTVNGGNGNDTITMTGGGGGNYYAGATLSGGGGNDTLTGANNAEVLIGGLGTDQMFGGSGDDKFDIFAPADVTVGEVYSGGAGTDTLDGSNAVSAIDMSLATLTGIEVIRGFNGGLTLTAGQANTVERINLFGGTLTLSSGGTVNLANTEMTGVAGFQLSDTATVLTISGDGAGGTYAPELFTGFVEGGSAGDTITIAESILFTAGYYGGLLDGNGGNDSLTGNARSETIVGGTGADQILAGDGDDMLRIESAADLATGETYDGGGGADTLDGISAAVDISGMAITFAGIETVEGFFGGLTLTAGQLGSIATEEINIGGPITLSGGGSVDLSAIRLFSDTIQLSNSGNSITVAAGAPTATSVGFSGTITGGNGNDTITVSGGYSGGGGTFVFEGGAGADTIDGSSQQSETIIGGLGNDVLDGGGGGTYADIFVFGAINSGADSIQNFAGATYAFVDRIQIIGGASSTYWVDTGAFLGGGQTSVRFATGLLRVDYDGNGTQDFSIDMNGLTEADFTQSTFI